MGFNKGFRKGEMGFYYVMGNIIYCVFMGVANLRNLK
jgi:hypothetical protein